MNKKLFPLMIKENQFLKKVMQSTKSPLGPPVSTFTLSAWIDRAWADGSSPPTNIMVSPRYMLIKIIYLSKLKVLTKKVKRYKFFMN